LLDANEEVLLTIYNKLENCLENELD